MKTDKRTLDRIDRALVGALTKNARLSNKELAAMVDLAPSSCLERVRRLVREGTIRGFVADVDPSALGYSIEAMMAVRLRQHSREHYDAFREHALTLPEVVAVYHMAGENDFMGKAMSLFMNMDAMVGKDFEAGLATLKTNVEAEHAKKLAEAKAAEEKAAAEAAAAAAVAGTASAEGAKLAPN